MFTNQLRSNISKSINMSSKRLSSSIVPVSKQKQEFDPEIKY